MKLGNALRDIISAALGVADGLGSATGAAKKIHLFKNDFEPSAESAVEDFVEADFTGATAKDMAVATGQVGLDALSGEAMVAVQGPTGDPKWIAGDAVNLPQTIYGWYLTDKDSGILLGYERFETPITLTAADQMVDVPDVEVRYDLDSFE